ncbi:MAG: hypothetical protein MJ216_02880 [Bacilli bacterium]|nr:hypothetical protein [Bacilli bacterium]
MKNQKKTLNPYLLVILSFVVIIFIGALLLFMPFARKDNDFASNFIDPLFLATSATCVTGLNSFKQGIGDELTFAGQLIIIILIQIGGLGFITLLTFFVTLFSGKLQFKDRLFISLMVNSEDAAEVVSFVRKIIIISFSFELIGFLLGLPVFLICCENKTEGIWYSLFTSISSYNNAGFDLFGSASLIRGVGGSEFVNNLPDWAYYYMCSYIMLLIVAGGISFVVVMDIFAKRKFKQLRVFTKISLLMTAILLVLGFLTFLISEGFTSPFDALFQSVTCRTAGFATINQDRLSAVSKAVSCFLMFFGGNPLGTAGGVKTTTLYIIVLAMICYLTGRKVTSFHRRYSNEVIVKAMSLVLLAVTTIFVAFFAMNAFESNLDMEAIGLTSTKSSALIYEVFSAFGTVGVTAGITPYLSVGSKIVIAVLMFIGRLGPITFFQLLGSKMRLDDKSKYRYVEEDFLIG